MKEEDNVTVALCSTNGWLYVRMHAVMFGVHRHKSQGERNGREISSLARVSIRACSEIHRMGERTISW